MKQSHTARLRAPSNTHQAVGKYIPQNPHMRRKAFIKTEVDNPYATGEDRSENNANTKAKVKERVFRRTSDNPLLVMFNRGHLDQAQFLAAHKYSGAHLVCSGQTGQAIDYSRQRVDCSTAPMTLSEKQMHASDLIRNAHKELEREGHNEKSSTEAVIRMQKIVGEGMTTTQYCQLIRGLTSSKSVKKQLGYLRDDLTVLAKYWGLER